MLSVRRYLANFVTAVLPPTRFYGLKAAIWRGAGVDVSPTARLVSSVKIWTSGPVSIGADTFLGHEVLIVGGDAPIVIGSRCDLAPRVVLVSGTHRDGGEHRAAGDGVSNPIEIGDGAWIGAAATVLGGVSVGAGAIVGAGSLVSKSISPYTVAVGAPCREIKSRAPSAPHPEST